MTASGAVKAGWPAPARPRLFFRLPQVNVPLTAPYPFTSVPEKEPVPPALQADHRVVAEDEGLAVDAADDVRRQVGARGGRRSGGRCRPAGAIDDQHQVAAQAFEALPVAEAHVHAGCAHVVAAAAGNRRRGAGHRHRSRPVAAPVVATGVVGRAATAPAAGSTEHRDQGHEERRAAERVSGHPDLQTGNVRPTDWRRHARAGRWRGPRPRGAAPATGAGQAAAVAHGRLLGPGSGAAT